MSDVRIARIFNTYGPRMRDADGRAVPQFVTQALAGAPITVYGDGSQTRSLCYVDDLIEGLMRLLRSDYRLPVNLGNPREVTMLQLAEIVRSICSSDSAIETRPLPVDDPQRRCPDVSVADPRTRLAGDRTAGGGAAAYGRVVAPLQPMKQAPDDSGAWPC